MISMQYPRKKLSRLKNPCDSSQMIDSQYVDSRVSNGKGQSNYDDKKFPNVFQFNDRSRVMVSDSDLGSSINNDSGENIYNFTSYKRPQQIQKVQEIVSYSGQFSPHSSNYYPNEEGNRFSFNQNGKFSSPEKEYENDYGKGKNVYYTEEQYSHTHTNKYQQMATQSKYDTPQKDMFTITEKPSETQGTNHHEYGSQVSSLRNSQAGMRESAIIKQSKRTFKPKFFQQFQKEKQTQQQHQLTQGIYQQNNGQKNTFRESKIDSKQRMSQRISHYHEYQLKQEVQHENIDIFVSPPLKNQSLLIKDKLKANILKEEKMNLSAGSEVHSQTQNILNHLRDQLECPNEQIQINLQSNINAEGFKKEIYQGKNIVESKIYQESHIIQSQSHEPQTNTIKKPRKRIFDLKTDRSAYDQTSLRKNPPLYVSQLEKNTASKQRDPSSSQILMKSLNIIDKMANKKTYQPEKESKHTAESVFVVPSSTLTITQSPVTSVNIYKPSQEQLCLQRQILQLNFELSAFQTAFDLEKFDKKDQINKIKHLNNASVQLFESYKNFILTNKIIDSQNAFYLQMKQQILNIRQKATKLANLQQKYIQTKGILSSFEEEIKNILLLNSKQKYKKLKLLNEAIQVMGKTQTYLSLQIGKISILIKTFVTRQKLLLEQLRDWLKQCIAKQNSH